MSDPRTPNARPAGDAGPGATPRAARCAGGYVLIPAVELAALWWAYRRDELRFLDLRAALAAREMAARRGHGGAGRRPDFGLPELARLTGAAPRSLRAALARLRRAGVLAWADDRLDFAPGAAAERPEFRAWLEAIPNHRRRVPVPRRILRHLAASARPVTVATALAVLFRCLYARGGGLAPRGRLKASWVASTFGVDRRRVLEARRGLVRLGWIAPDPGDTQAARNRWGAAYLIDLNWTPRAGAEMTPPKAGDGAETPPPLVHRDPLPGPGNQDPAPGGPAGARRRRGGGPGPGPPDLGAVRPEDLADTARTLELHRQAAERGAVGAGEADRLRVLAAAEHARSIGTRNPCGLFAAIVARGLWSHLTAGDEAAASRRLRAHLRGRPAAVAPGSGPRPAAPGASGPPPSPDGELLRAVRAVAGGEAAASLALRCRPGGWTRERYERAAAELGGGRRDEGREATSSGGVASLGAALAVLGDRLATASRRGGSLGDLRPSRRRGEDRPLGRRAGPSSPP